MLVVVALVAATPLVTPRVAPAAVLPVATAMPSRTPLVTATAPPLNTKPTITITPAPGEFAIGAQVAVTVEYCDSHGLDLSTKTLTYNAVNLSWKTTYTIGNPGPCLARAVASGTVTVMEGSNTVRASIEDDDFEPLWSGWKVATYTTPIPWAGVTVIPENQFVDAAPSTGTTQRFVVTNIGDATKTFTFGASGSGSVSNVTPLAPPPVSLAPGASTTVTTTATSPSAAPNWGRVTLTATGAGQTASAWTEITSITSPGLTNWVEPLNPTGIVEKSLCVSIAVGPGAAAECGDLRLAYGLPGVVTKGKGRAPTLIYSAQSAHPTIVIPADLSLTSVVLGSYYTATVVITSGPLIGTSFPAGTWLADDWYPSGRRRILATFDGASLPTGRFTYRLDVQSTGGTIYSTWGELLSVNRSDSYFNAGWWLAGLELLVPYAPNSATVSDILLWVGGDGSARVFTETAANSCVFLHEALDRPDSIVGTPSGGACVSRSRRSSNGMTVVFDDLTHQHRQTINRLGEITDFAYRSTDGKLESITVPSGSVARTYRFVYTGGVLDTIHAPRVVESIPRFVTLQTVTGGVMGGSARSRTVAFRSAALDTVAFGYQGGNGASQGDYRIVTRTDRMNVTTTFTYDAAYRVASSSVPASGTQTITQTLRAAEGQGVGTGLPGQALALDSVYTRLDGPRSDVADVNKWWVNRYGAPTRVRNAVGLETRIAYVGAWPALPATATDAAGVTTTATYHATRALVLQTTVQAPFGGSDAVTTIAWDNKWDMPTTTIDASGVQAVRTYDAATGNLLSERLGANPAGTTSYVYDGITKQLKEIHTPGVGSPDLILYDSLLGNVMKTKSPRGVVMTAFKDRLGRDTLVLSSTHAVTDTVTNVQRRRILYDLAGRVRETVTSAPGQALYVLQSNDNEDPTPIQAETLFVRTTFDLEGRPRTINAFSRPSLGTWDQCGDPVGKCRGVPENTEGSYDIRTYDWVGRPLTQRLGSGPAQVTYDPAGNVVSEITRNGETLTSTYDAANRLVKRIVPSVRFPSEACEQFAYGILYGPLPLFHCWMLFPLYHNSGNDLLVPGDTVRMVYDASGRLVRADNKDARITRSYFPSGALQTDSIAMRDYASNLFTTTLFSQSYTYDVAGRRLSHVLPANLNDGTLTYAYDADRGYLSDVWHGADHIRLHLDEAGRQDSLRVFRNISGSDVLGAAEHRRYDEDGQLRWLERTRNEGGFMVRLFMDSLTYDARGKITAASIQSASADVGNQEVRNHYSGMGAVVASEKWNNLSWESEQFRTTAMGEVHRSRSDVSTIQSRFPVVSHFDVNGALLRKMPVLPTPDSLYSDTTYATYDAAGNQTRSGAVFQRPGTDDRYYTATRNYYAADNRLVVVQRNHATSSARSGAWEEFRYDALGRRILTRSRRGHNGHYDYSLCSSSGPAYCDGYLERTVWDGDQVLYELRANGNDDQTAYALNTTLYSTGYAWGKAGYVHAGGIDKPIMTMDGRVPTYNWRGLPESSVWTTGAKADCSLVYAGCQLVSWPSANSIYLKPPPFGGGGGPPQWVGSVLADGVGSTGMAYRRNRFYDGATGQFTQQDPIGLAGGLNLYGFANGDPINFSDPFGLCPKGEICRRYVFAHLSSTSVAKGGEVGAGAQIGETGNSGRSTGPHLHYEEGAVDKNGNYTADVSGDVSCPLANCSNVSSRPAGMRTTTVDGETVTRPHNGTDYATATGTAVFAPAGGDVVKEGYQDKTNPRKGYGLRIVIDVVIPQPKP